MKRLDTKTNKSNYIMSVKCLRAAAKYSIYLEYKTQEISKTDLATRWMTSRRTIGRVIQEVELARALENLRIDQLLDRKKEAEEAEKREYHESNAKQPAYTVAEVEALQTSSYPEPITEQPELNLSHFG